MTQEPRWENICALVVTYHPSEGFSDRLKRIAAQVGRVVVVDNGSESIAAAMSPSNSAKLDAYLIQNQSNLGIATALNQGMRWALENGYSWVLTMDQDTVVDHDMIKSLQDIYDVLPHPASIGIIAADFRNGDGYWKPKAASHINWTEPSAVITSGSLVSLRAFSIAGDFREDFFIDKVDTEYCLRLRSLGYMIYMSSKPLMTHFMGNLKRHKLLWREVKVYNHSALRRYYITRNRLVLAKAYLLREPRAMWFEFRMMLLEFFYIVLYESNKANKLHAILLGICDAFSGRMGKQARPFGEEG